MRRLLTLKRLWYSPSLDCDVCWERRTCSRRQQAHRRTPWQEVFTDQWWQEKLNTSACYLQQYTEWSPGIWSNSTHSYFPYIPYRTVIFCVSLRRRFGFGMWKQTLYEQMYMKANRVYLERMPHSHYLLKLIHIIIKTCCCWYWNIGLDRKAMTLRKEIGQTIKTIVRKLMLPICWCRCTLYSRVHDIVTCVSNGCFKYTTVFPFYCVAHFTVYSSCVLSNNRNSSVFPLK